MFTGSGHEPHYFPELDGASVSRQPTQRTTVVFTTAVGSAIAFFLVLLSWFVGVRFFGDQSPMTAAEMAQRSRFQWLALAVFAVTMAVAFLFARRVEVSWPVRVGLVLVGVVAGIALCVTIVVALLGVL